MAKLGAASRSIKRPLSIIEAFKIQRRDTSKNVDFRGRSRSLLEDRVQHAKRAARYTGTACRDAAPAGTRLDCLASGDVGLEALEVGYRETSDGSVANQRLDVALDTRRDDLGPVRFPRRAVVGRDLFREHDVAAQLVILDQQFDRAGEARRREGSGRERSRTCRKRSGFAAGQGGPNGPHNPFMKEERGSATPSRQGLDGFAASRGVAANTEASDCGVTSSGREKNSAIASRYWMQYAVTTP